MPKPVFDIEQYELRNLIPEVYTPEQKDRLNQTLARVNGQIDWTAQLLGFNGPNYWGLADRKADGTYNWKGLPDTVNQKRRMQVGAFGLYNKDKDYAQWPAPFNRKEIAASADGSFHLFEKESRTFAAPWGQGELIDYMHDPVLYAGGYYIFDKEIEVEGREIDVENFVEYYSFKEIEGTFTRLRILDTAIGGTLLIKAKGSIANPVPFEMAHWTDISDWTANTIRRQFIGMWGNKGNQLSMDFAFDSLDLYGNDESYSLRRSDKPASITPAELLERAGLNPTFWTNINNDPYLFTSENCGQWSAVSPYLNGPLEGFNWRPEYIEDETVILNCTENCDYDLTITQVLSDEDDYDNGDYSSFHNSDTIYNNAYYEWGIPDSNVTEDNSSYGNQPNAQTTIDEIDYDHFPKPTEGFVDAQTLIKPIQSFLDNGFLEADPPASGVKDEGEYDRNPYRYIERFDIRFIPKTDRGLMMTSPCLEWVMDPDLDNGEFESVECTINYVNCSSDNPTRPWAGVDDGFYDKTKDNVQIIDSTQTGIACEADVSTGYDDGEYGMLFVDQPCVYQFEGCEADNGVYSVVYGPPSFLSECDWQCPPIDNETYTLEEGGFLGPRTTSGGELGYERYLPPGCTYVEGGEYFEWDPEEDCDCNVTCCEVDQGLVTDDRMDISNKVDGQTYTFDDPYPEPSPIPPIPCAENQPSLKICEANRINVNLSKVIAAIPYVSVPNLRNVTVPLRTWKDRPIVIKDEVDTADLEYWNYLTTDNNKGFAVEGGFRHFIRLPLNYQRDGREWNKASAVCNNQSYFSSPSTIQDMDSEPAQPRPLLYSENYKKKLDQDVVMYEEDFLYSSIDQDTESVQPGFEDSALTGDLSMYIAYNLAVVSDYDPYSVRIPYSNGEWRGGYYAIGTLQRNLTGYLSTDLDTHRLITAASPVYDESIIKRPNVEFPGGSREAAAKNFVVSYAYFSCDFSAADDPLFDPDKSQCWRKREIGSGKIDPSIVLPADSLDSACVDDIFTTNTSYLLHPVT